VCVCGCVCVYGVCVCVFYILDQIEGAACVNVMIPG